MVKPWERNTRYVDMVQTIPKGVLYPMCGMNLAFDRHAIGAAMYFGLQGEGQPLGRYDDMWAGWCTKVGSDWDDAVIISIDRGSYWRQEMVQLASAFLQCNSSQ